MSDYKKEGCMEEQKKLKMVIHKLLTMKKRFDQLSINNNEELFWEKLLSSALDLIAKAYYGSVYQYKDGKVNFIDAVGHNIDILKNLDINQEVFHLSVRKNKATILKDVLDINKDKIDKNNYKAMAKATKPIKESITFDLHLKGEAKGGITLDIEKDSDNEFDKRDIELLEFILDTAQSFYEKDMEEAYKKQHAYFKQLFNKSIEAIALLDNENKVININKSFENLFGYKLEEIKGFDIDNFIIQGSKKEEGKEYTKIVANKKEVKKETVRKNKNGEHIPVSLYAFPITLDNGQIGIYAMYNDITERKKEEDKIKYLSFHDQLTGLYNRHYFEDTISRLNHSRKLPVGVITADIDNLKQINDLYGHNIGDKYIKMTAKVIKSSIREGDIASRIGGDEFAIILPEVERQDIINIKERIREKIENIDFKDLDFSISIGFEIKTSQEENLDDIINDSDKKMYRMKKKTKEENLKKKLSIMKNKKEIVFEEIPIAIMIADFEGKILDINNKLCDMLGYSEKELKKMTHFDITRDIDNKKNRRYLEKLRNKEINSFELDKKYIKKNGQYLDVHIKVKVITDHCGEPVFDCAFISDK